MIYGRDNFIDVDDLNLDELLGEYTCSKIESDWMSPEKYPCKR